MNKTDKKPTFINYVPATGIIKEIIKQVIKNVNNFHCYAKKCLMEGEFIT